VLTRETIAVFPTPSSPSTRTLKSSILLVIVDLYKIGTDELQAKPFKAVFGNEDAGKSK
jgi:hypothetical protein